MVSHFLGDSHFPMSFIFLSSIATVCIGGNLPAERRSHRPNIVIVLCCVVETRSSTARFLFPAKPQSLSKSHAGITDAIFSLLPTTTTATGEPTTTNFGLLESNNGHVRFAADAAEGGDARPFGLCEQLHLGCCCCCGRRRRCCCCRCSQRQFGEWARGLGGGDGSIAGHRDQRQRHQQHQRQQSNLITDGSDAR